MDRSSYTKENGVQDWDVGIDSLKANLLSVKAKFQASKTTSSQSRTEVALSSGGEQTE